MISAASTGSELRRFRRGTLPKVAVGALILIPLLYGALYLWAFWDPTGNMDKLPVALVNEDVAAQRDGEPVDAGAQITEKLVESGDLDWRVTSRDDALAGVSDGDYYFAVTIPADFSETIVSAGGDAPEQARIDVTYNDANSFLATTLGRSAMVQVESAVREEIGAHAVDTVLVGLGSARDGFATASDGAIRLTDASDQVADGAVTLADGAASAADGSASLAEGLRTLADGVSSAHQGVARLDDGAQRLDSGASTLADGASDLATGTSTLAKGGTTLASGAGKLATGAGTLADGTGDLADGATALADGLADAHDGATDLAEGAASAADGADALSTGAQDLRSGTARLADGAHSLAAGLAASQPTIEGLPQQLADVATLLTQNTAMLAASDPSAADPKVQGVIAANKEALAKLGALDGATLVERFQAAATGAAAIDAQLHPSTGTEPTLRDGVDQLAAGATSLSTGLGTLEKGAGALADGTSKLSDGATALATGATAVDKGASRLATSSTTLSQGSGTLAKGLKDAAKGARTLSAGAETLSDGTRTLSDGTSELAGGASRLRTGARSAATGAGTLADGTARLADGADRLADGTTQLHDGAGQLADGLASGAEQIPDDDANLRAQRAAVVAAPVTVADSDLAQAEGFGEGFAPFFLSLALFVGALITWLVLRPVPPRALAAPVSGWRVAIAGYLPGLLIGAAQAGVMLSVVALGLGMDLTNVPGTIAFTVLVAATFFALQQAILALAGPAAGKVLILALLMLQLAGSGGTYPVQTTASFFQAIHPWLPMSYAVQGLRQVITGGADGRLVASTLVLGGVLLGSLAVTAWRASRMRTWTLDRLHPAIAL
ncbi:putative membrane protein [Flavimobilis soli]|uniref:Putative membrane protein n=1 Tax=Flavimobilis soli TaxID=442709 RepID=A0A2A9ECQ3_9MICO|nr:YhgE/Pip domain-containing protein [Flavimobilis soli]PFG36684.1 putative membrane protein [Flavimobilis soli]